MRASSEQSGGGEVLGEAAVPTSLAPTPSATPTVPLASSTPAVVDSAATPWLDKPTVKMEGYLEKKGKMRVVAMWKRYWFVLEGRLLLYYKSQQEYARLSPCRGSLNMGLASCVRPGAHTGAGAGLGAEQHVLEVVLRSHVVSLRAKDRACQERWLQALLDSMASSSATSPGRDPGKGSRGQGRGHGHGHGKGQGPLHFRYPSADNLSKADHDHGRGNIREEEDAPQSGHSEKRHTLPNWNRTPSTELMLVTVPEKAVPSGGTPNLIQDKLPEGLHIAPRKAQAGKTGGINLTRQGSILPILGKKDKANKHSSPQAVHPVNTQDSPFGSQRYSFHGFQKVGDVGNDSASKKDRKDLERSSKSKGFRNFESVLKKQLSFSSPSSAKDVCTKSDSFVGTPILEDVLKATNGCAEKNLNCKFCHIRNIEGGRCICQNIGTPELEEEEKENFNIRKSVHLAASKKYHPDENQNQLFQDSLETTKVPVSLGKNQSSSEKDLLITSGVDLSPERENPKPIRCTSADQLWSAPRKSFGEIHVKHSKFEQMGPDAQYFSASDIRHPCNTLDSHRSEPTATDKSKLVKLSIRQRLLHGNGEYIKYSEPEDCDKRDSTLNTTTDSQPQDPKAKPKMRMRKRKGSSSKDSYSLADSNDGKKRAPVRNRLSFLTRVLSHVRRAKSEDIMDHPETEGIFSDDAFLSPHPDMNSKCSTPVSRVLDDVKKMGDTPSGSNPLGTNFQIGPSNPVFGEAPEEPPPDYDSVGVEQLNNSDGCSVGDTPPQLPPRRTKRPRSPWHDVPTNNSPVVDVDNDARLRLLSAAKYGRVIGTRTSNSIDFYDWSDSHPSDNSQHHAYEVVSDDPSTPAGSNEHLAIYLSSESSDEEFHEEMVLRRNIQDREFLFGSEGGVSPLANVTKPSAMEPLTIRTNILPTLDSSGRVGLSHVEAVKLNLLMQAQRTSTESIIRRRGEHDDQNCSKPSKAEEHVVKSYPISNNCLQQPPEEFADKEDLPLITAAEVSEKVKVSVKGLFTPTEKLFDSREGSVVDSELNSIVHETNITKVEEVRELILSNNILDEPPQLPSKKMKGIWKPDNCEPESRHSDELNDLLAQLAGMTTAPLLPVGAGCSLQINQVHGADGEVTTAPTAVKKQQSLSLDAFANMYDSEPDYDVPRPHASLLHILPQNGRTFQNYRPGDDDIVVEATHFFSRPESPRHVAMDDQSLNGHMSPDSLDFPFTPRRASTWEPCYSNTGNGQDGPQTQKARPIKDRNRRATLSGPLIHQTGEPAPYQPAPLVRRNSMELPPLEAEADVYARSVNQKERGMTEPKQVKMLSTHDVTCEHNSSPLSSLSQSYTPCIGEVCKKIEILTSLEDISEKSELNSDSISSRHIINSVSQARTLPRPDELDMDSLEASEFKKVDVPELITTALLSIVEEPDTLSERSDKCSEGTGQSSGSTSEGAVMFDGNSSATDQQTHNTDTEMEMPSDDEMGHPQDQHTLDDVRRVIEPDSLLPEPFAVGNGEQNDFGQMVESDSAKDASLETDSLELKK